MSMPIQRQSEAFGVFDDGPRYARDKGNRDLPSGLAALINTSGPRITGGLLNTRDAGMHYPDEYDPRVDGYPEENLDRPSSSDFAEEDWERNRQRNYPRGQGPAWNHDSDFPDPDLENLEETGDPERFLPPSQVDPREARRGSGRLPFDRSASYDDADPHGTCRWCGEDVSYLPHPEGGYDYQHEEHPFADYGHPAEPEGNHHEDGPSWYDETDPQPYRQANRLTDFLNGPAHNPEPWTQTDEGYQHPSGIKVRPTEDGQWQTLSPAGKNNESLVKLHSPHPDPQVLMDWQDYSMGGPAPEWHDKPRRWRDNAFPPSQFGPKTADLAQPELAAPDVPQGGGYQAGHRVKLIWRPESHITGTVIGAEGPNVVVRWDDGQYSVEEPRNIQLL